MILRMGFWIKYSNWVLIRWPQTGLNNLVKWHGRAAEGNALQNRNESEFGARGTEISLLDILQFQLSFLVF